MTEDQREILGLERAYWQAMKDSDIDSAVELTRFPCLVTGPQGASRIGRDEYVKLMKSHRGQTTGDLRIENPQVEMIRDDLAVITYQLIRDGKACADASTWIREDETWRCVAHSETPLGTHS